MGLYRALKTTVRRSAALLERMQQNGYSVLHLVNRELKTAASVPLRQRLWAYRHGYLSSSVPLYGLDATNRDEYLSQWQSERARQINGESALLHEDKLLFYYVLWPAFSDVLPELYGYLSHGRFLDTPFSSGTDETLRNCVDRAGTVVVKPVGGTLGSGVTVIEASEDEYRLNGEQTQAKHVEQVGQQSGEYIVTEYIEQTGYAAAIYPGSANTIRVMTMIDPDTQEPFVGAIGHRFGTDESAPVDNTAKGGISAGVDIETGELEAAFSPPETETVPQYTTHPDTGAEIRGVEIPDWQRIHDRLLELADYLAPITPYIGWDVLVTDDDGSITILEANSYPDVPLQYHRPLLADERVKRFYEYHDVL